MKNKNKGQPLTKAIYTCMKQEKYVEECAHTASKHQPCSAIISKAVFLK